MAALRTAYCAIYCLGLLPLIVAGLLGPAWAQVATNITADGSLGTTVTRDGNIFAITAGTQQGGNLFHSFDRFDVGPAHIARFTGPATIENILSRVTGGQPSMIDGTLQSDIAGANLFLLNPSGVMFGLNARLDVQGSFYVSTADVLHFEDGALLSAHLDETSTLTVEPPAAFGFLQEMPKAIVIQESQLRVSQGETVSIVGGNIRIEGASVTSAGPPNLAARDGRIAVVSVASPGDVRLASSEPSPALHEHLVTRFGDITISATAAIRVVAAGGGTVVIQGGRVLIDNATVAAFARGQSGAPTVGVELHATEEVVVSQNGEILTQQVGSARSGNIRITAKSLQMQEGTSLTSVAQAGPGGDIRVEVERLTLTGGAQIVSTTTGTGQGGSVVVTAADTIRFTGRASDDVNIRSGISLLTDDSGDAGNIDLQAPTVHLEDGGIIETNTTGSGGSGNITIEVERLTLTDGSTIDTTTFPGAGRGGDVTIRAKDIVKIAGSSPTGFRSGIFSRTDFGREAGNISLYAPTVMVYDKGRIDSIALGTGSGGRIDIQVGRLTLAGGAQINSSAVGTGQGGQVQIIATDTIALSGRDSGLLTDAEAQAMGGGITLEAQTIQLTEAAVMTAQSSGSGNAGIIMIKTHDTFSSQNSAITTAAARADGGDILLQARLVNLRHSALKAEAHGGVQGASDGGNVTIDAAFVVLNNSQVQANAFGGDGGTIAITATGVFLADAMTCGNGQCLNASSELGIDGTVEVRAAVTNLSRIVSPLPQAFAPALALLRQRCAQRQHGAQVTRFILASRDRVPAGPGNVLPSPSPLYRTGQSDAATAAKAGTQHLRGKAGVGQRVTQKPLAFDCATWRAGQADDRQRQRVRLAPYLRRDG